MKLLDHRQIDQKIKRLAIEILEQNYNESEIILAGINNNGVGFAKILMKELVAITDKIITLTELKLSPAAPLSTDVTIGIEKEELTDKVIIIVDDVANTGRTIFYAYKPLLEILPKKIQVAVLVDRKHKSFPIKVDYVGLSLFTTMQDDIDVKIKGKKERAVYLK